MATPDKYNENCHPCVTCMTKEQICHAGNSLPVWAGAVGKFELHMLLARCDPNSYPKSQHTIPAMQSRNHVARGLTHFFFAWERSGAASAPVDLLGDFLG